MSQLDAQPEILIPMPLLLDRQTSGLSCLTQRTPNSCPTPGPGREGVNLVKDSDEEDEGVVPGTPPSEKDKKCWAPERPKARKRKAEEEEDKSEDDEEKDEADGDKKKKSKPAVQKKLNLNLGSASAGIQWEQEEGLDEATIAHIAKFADLLDEKMSQKMFADHTLICRRTIDFVKLAGRYNSMDADDTAIILSWKYEDAEGGTLTVRITPNQMELTDRGGSKVRVGSPEMAAFYFKPMVESARASQTN